MKKILSIVLVFVLIVQYPFFVYASSEMEECLRESGMPECVIEQLSEMQKETIYNEIIGCNATYSSCHSEELNLSNEGISTCSTISTSDLTITVVAYDATKNGEACTMLFPSFKWNTPVKIQNDVFAYALYSGWEAMTDESLSVWIYNVNGEKVQSSR